MATVLCWGNGKFDQLGFGGYDDAKTGSPRIFQNFSDKNIAHISCGEHHTLCVFTDGSVYSCGNNDEGQLGHDKLTSKPEKIIYLDVHDVISSAAGGSHSLILTRAGEIFTWGNNSYGQLGRGQLDAELRKTPKLVKTLAKYFVVQIASGRDHSLALTDDGQLYTWGANTSGQLGVGSPLRFIDTPTCVQCLLGIPMRQIVGGGSHSFVLTCSGALFGWGRNSFGQLGVSDDQDRPNPTQCKFLRYQKIKFVTCGGDHTSALNQDGRLFTFGAGSFGQLGHNSYNNELLPKIVMELMGSEVTQIACGRRHTLAYVPVSGKLYSFGLGSSGQLGLDDSSNRNSPCRVKGPFTSHVDSESIMVVDNQTPMYVIERVFSGGEHCYVITTTTEDSGHPLDYRVLDPKMHILHLNPEIIRSWCNMRPQEIPSEDVLQEIDKIFSSSSCINASFLLPNDAHFGCNSKNHGVDLPLARELLSNLEYSKNMAISQKICTHIEQSLLPSIPRSPPDMEALRLYLVLPKLPFFDQPKYYATLICPFGQQILRLDKTASKVLDLWWSSLPSSCFSSIVYIYKQCITYILDLPLPSSAFDLENRNRGLFIAKEVLRKLNTVNETAGMIIPYHQFYISQLIDKVDIRTNYIKWVQQRGMIQDSMSFCSYPFLFDAAAKAVLLQTDAMIQMQTAIEEVNRCNFSSMFNMLPIDPVSPCLVLCITRENIVQDTLIQLGKHANADLKKPLKVIIRGEEAIDAGGVRKEFFLLLMNEILDPKYGMFKAYEDSRLLWFHSQSYEDDAMYHLIGILCGLAIYNVTIIPLYFPLSLFKKLLRRPVVMKDLMELMPTVGKGFQEMLDYDGDDFQEIYDMTFEVTQECFGQVNTVELIPGGKNTQVTKKNRNEYVEAYIDYVFTKSVEGPFKAFSEGFHKVCGGRVLELFQPQELQAMVVGNDNYDFIEFEKNVEYKAEFHRYHETIQYFWLVFHDLELETKKKFLSFLTGSDRIPVMGMKSLKMIIQPVCGGEDYLPVAHTCFNLLDLPKYTSSNVLKKKLLQAVDQSQGFGLV